MILAALNGIRSFVFSELSTWVDLQLSPQLIENCLTDIQSTTPKSQIQVLLRDVSTLKQTITGPIMTTLFDIPWILIFLCVIWFIHPLLAIVTFIGAIVLTGLALLNSKVTEEPSKAAHQSFIDNLAKIDRFTRYSNVIKAMGMQTNIISRWKTAYLGTLDLQTSTMKKANIIGAITKFFRLVIQLSITGLGGFLVLKMAMTPGGIIATSILSGKVLAPFDQAIQLWKSAASFKESYDRLNLLLNDYQDKPSITLPEITGTITLDGISHALGKSTEYFLKSIDLSIPAGQSIGIIGPSGAGKTTLSNCIAGIIQPTKGNVRLDNATLTYINPIQLSRVIGYMPQQVGLFEGTIQDNIARFDPNASDNDVIAAAQFTGTHELILKFKDGYATEVGPDGSLLSAGQRQLIGLTRACYQQPKLIILDEPNSNLDDLGERLLFNCIQKIKQANLTLVLISHKPNVIQLVDRVLVMQAGTIVLDDTPTEIAKKLSGKQPNPPEIAS